MVQQNSVVEAFVRGRAIKDQQDARNKASEEAKARLDEEKRQFDEQQKAILDQHKADNARLDAVAELSRSMQTLQQQQQLEEHYAKYGTTSAPYQEDQSAAQSVQVAPGVAGTSRTFTQGTDKNLPSSFSSVDPETAALIQGHASEIINAPKAAEAIRLKQMEIDAEDRKQQSANIAKMAEATVQYQRDLAKIEKQTQGRIEVENIRNKTRMTPEERAKAALNVKLDTPLDPKVQREEFGLDYSVNNTPRNLEGRKLLRPLTPTEEAKETDFSVLQTKTALLKAKLDEKIDPKDKNSQTWGERYYSGFTSGLYDEASGKFDKKGLPKKLEDIRALTSDIETTAKNLVGKFGGALTGGEQQLLEKFAPSPDFKLNYNRARSIFDNFENGLTIRQNESIKARHLGGTGGDRKPLGDILGK
jgi:hypothetical protein